MKDFQITLIDRKEICENTIAFWFGINKREYLFEAGQYAHFTIIEPKLEDKKGNSRALSIASSPNNQDKLMIAARKNSSIFINNLSMLPIGAIISISKPMGALKLPNDISIPSVFVAGGIGITPVRSIVEDTIQRNLPHQINLFYSNRTESQTAFLAEFERWAQENKNFKFIPTIDDINNKNWNYEYGLVDSKMIIKYLNTLKDKIFYLVGPPLMVDSVKSSLIDEGVPEEKIKTEKFK